jgi:hypothetical protein
MKCVQVYLFIFPKQNLCFFVCFIFKFIDLGCCDIYIFKIASIYLNHSNVKIHVSQVYCDKI